MAGYSNMNEHCVHSSEMGGLNTQGAEVTAKDKGGQDNS